MLNIAVDSLNHSQ